MAFKIDQQVVHPRHGIMRIVKLEARTFGAGPEHMYYQLEFSNGTVWVQVDEAASGLRQLITVEELDGYRELLASSPARLASDHRERQNELTLRLKDASFRARCELVRDLQACTWKKSLNDSFSHILRSTYNAVCAEWAAVTGLTLSQAIAETDALLLSGRKAYEQAG